MPCGKFLRQLVHGLAHRARHLERVRARRLEDAHRDRVLVVEHRAQRVAARRQLDARDVAEARDLSAGAGLDDDVAELVLGGQPAARVDGQREVDRAVHGHAADHAGRDLHVLVADGADDVGRRQAARRDLVGIEPDAHGVVAGAEDHHLAHARDARQHVLHLQHGVVAQVHHVVAVVGRHQVHDHRDVGRALDGGDAELPHLLGQARQRLADAVLHLHLREVDVGAHAEGDGQLSARRRRSPATTCRACSRRR